MLQKTTIRILIATSLTALMVTRSSSIEPLTPEWVVTWGGARFDQAWDVIEHDGFLYVTGVDGVTSDNIDIFIRQYDTDGNLNWEERWDNGPRDEAFVIVTDGEYLYLGGFTQVETTNLSLLQKREMDGTVVWTRMWGPMNAGHHEVDGIAVVGDAIYVSHYFGSWLVLNINAVLKRFDPDGNEIWSTSWGDPLQNQDTTDGHIYADSTGVWVAGRVDGGYFMEGDAYLTKISPDGEQLWLERWGEDGYDQALSLASDGRDIYLSGWTDQDGAGEFDSFLLKYNRAGSYRGGLVRGGPSIEFSRGVEVDDSGVYLSTYTLSGGASTGATVLQKYHKRYGTLLGVGIWDETGEDAATSSIAMDDSFVYLSGKTTSLGANDYDAVLLKAPKW